MISAQLWLPTTADILWWVLIETAFLKRGVVGGKAFFCVFWWKFLSADPHLNYARHPSSIWWCPDENDDRAGVSQASN